MFKIIAIDGQDRLVLVCNWCHKPITEDIHGNIISKKREDHVEGEQVIFLHTHCSYLYKTEYYHSDEKWEWRSLTTFREMIYLENRKPLESMVVSLRAPTISNQLHYQSSASDEHILVIATEESREKAFTLTLGGGTVTFDLDRDRCLFRVQVNIPRELWKISEIPMIPRFIDSASLIFREVAYSYEWIEGSEEYLSVKTNTDHDFAYIILDNPKQDINWIQLSSVFFVALTQDKLLAMLVWLDAKQIPDGGFA